MTPAEQLKALTEADHRRIDQHPAMQRLFAADLSEAEYARVLQAMSRWLISIRPLLARSAIVTPVDIDSKLALLHKDLANLGEQKQQLPAQLTLTQLRMEPLGLSYLIEGSMLGGQLIAKKIETQLNRTEICNYYRCYGADSRSVWDSVREQLNTLITTRAQLDAAVAAAKEGFALLEQQLNASALDDRDPVADQVVGIGQFAELAQPKSREISQKTAFLSVISHEIRTPLHAIMGLTELISDEQIPLKVQRNVEKIRIASGALLNVLNSTVDAARAEIGALKIVTYDTDLLALAEDLTQIFALNAEAKGVSLHLNFDSRMFGQHFEADKTHLQQILSNLLGNAVKFTDQGAINLWVAQRAETETETEIYFAVSDTGIGIPDEMQTHIFEPFSQIENIQKGRPDGSGLGLSISQKMVQQLGGTLELSSSQDGSRFFFTLRLKKVATDQPPVRIPDDQIVRIIAQPEVQVELIRNLLEAWGARVLLYPKISDELLRQSAPLTLVDQGIAAQDPVRWRQLESQATEHQLLVMRSELDPSGSKLFSEHRSWFYPLLPSELLRYVQAAGLTEKHWPAIPGSEPDSPAELVLDDVKLLCVDDSPTNQIVLKGQLTKLGCRQILLAENGARAVQIAQESQPDLIFMDFNMPVMDGVEASTILREQGFVKPIIGLTALTEEDARQRGQSAIFNEIVHKPIDRLHLQACLRRWLTH